MKRQASLGLMLMAVLAFASGDAFGKGGGHGGGHHGGGHHGGHHGSHHSSHHHSSHHHSSHHHASHHHHSGHHDHHDGHHDGHHGGWAGGWGGWGGYGWGGYGYNNFDRHYYGFNRPFTSDWYARHPNAWNYTHVAGPWAAANYDNAAAWLGWGNAPAINYTPVGMTYNENVNDESDDDGDDDDSEDGDDDKTNAVANNNTANNAKDSDNDSDDDGDDEDSEDGDDDDSQSAPDEAAVAAQIAGASQLAAQGAGDLSPDSEWLPLGTYGLSAHPDSEATHLLQLFVSKKGHIRGSYYDMTGDNSQTIKGAVDQLSQKVAFTVGDGKVVFQTGLANLTQEISPISVHFENGHTTAWCLTRLKETPESKPEVEKVKASDTK